METNFPQTVMLIFADGKIFLEHKNTTL